MAIAGHFTFLHRINGHVSKPHKKIGKTIVCVCVCVYSLYIYIYIYIYIAFKLVLKGFIKISTRCRTVFRLYLIVELVRYGSQSVLDTPVVLSRRNLF
jgi:hypothetical protein